MIKLLSIRVLSFIVLTLLFLSTSWVEVLTIEHVLCIMVYASALPLIWCGCDWLFGVNRERRNTSVGETTGGNLRGYGPSIRGRCGHDCCPRRRQQG
jgi:hypothetical protein